MSTKNKLESIFGSLKQSNFVTTAAQWEADETWKEKSQDIALELLEYMDEKKLTQKAFAELMGVTPQAVNKWLRGQENFTLETIGKMERVLGRNLIQVVSAEESSTMVIDELKPITQPYPSVKPAVVKLNAKLINMPIRRYDEKVSGY